MFAAKLHACFYREYIKGGDFYDFIWYMSNKVKPNFVLLNNAIEQTQGKSPVVGEGNFKEFLLKGIERVDFKSVRKDVERFLEDKRELGLLDADLVKSSIDSHPPNFLLTINITLLEYVHSLNKWKTIS